MARLRQVAALKRGLCLLLILTAAFMLVLFQALQLPTHTSSRFLDLAEPVLALPNLSEHQYVELQQQIPKSTLRPGFFRAPVPSVCYGLSSPCLESLLLQQSPKSKSRAEENIDEKKIPPILHLTCVGKLDSNQLTHIGALLRDWHRLHRKWVYVLWTKEEVHKLVEVFYPRFLNLLIDLNPKESMLLARIMILQKYGGVVIDAAHSGPARSLDALRWMPAVFVVNDGNWPSAQIDAGMFMAARGHPFVQYCTDRAIHFPAILQTGLTQLMLNYASSFPSADKAEHSIQLAYSGFTGRLETKSNLTELPKLLRKCQIMRDILNNTELTASPHNQISCLELLAIRHFLTNAQTFFPSNSYQIFPLQTLQNVENLLSRYTFLNIGRMRSWYRQP